MMASMIAAWANTGVVTAEKESASVVSIVCLILRNITSTVALQLASPSGGSRGSRALNASDRQLSRHFRSVTSTKPPNGNDLREVVTYCTPLEGQQLLGMAGILGTTDPVCSTSPFANDLAATLRIDLVPLLQGQRHRPAVAGSVHQEILNNGRRRLHNGRFYRQHS